MAEAIGRYFAETTEESIRDTYARRTKTAGFLAQSLDEYQKQVSELHGRRERLAHAFASGKMAVDIYSTTDRQLLAQEEELARKVRDLEAAIAAQPDLEAQIRGLLWLRNNLCRSLGEGARYGGQDPAGRRLAGTGRGTRSWKCAWRNGMIVHSLPVAIETRG